MEKPSHGNVGNCQLDEGRPRECEDEFDYSPNSNEGVCG